MQFRFGRFRVDPRSSSLYFDDKPVETVNKKSIQVLVVLLEKANEVLSHDEIIARVWGDNYHGATANNVAQYIGKLRKALDGLYPGTSFIGTAPNRGYIFEAEVTVFAEVERNKTFQFAETENGVENLPLQVSSASPQVEKEPKKKNFWLKLLVPASALVLAVVAAIAAGSYLRVSDKDQVKQVVKEAQLYELLILYKDPKSFKETDLDKYWTPELDFNLNYDRKNIRKGVNNLLEKEIHYGNETKCVRFEIQSDDVDVDNKTAWVKTLEEWFIAEYSSDETLVRNKSVGPYFVNYILRKTDGRWLIEKSNTGRATPMPPLLLSLQPTAEIVKNQRSFVKISGEDFLPELIFIKVIGEGCPETNPCVVPNSALRIFPGMSANSLENVPLTLASGNFKIVAVNGNSGDSNALQLLVP